MLALSSLYQKPCWFQMSCALLFSTSLLLNQQAAAPVTLDTDTDYLICNCSYHNPMGVLEYEEVVGSFIVYSYICLIIDQYVYQFHQWTEMQVVFHTNLTSTKINNLFVLQNLTTAWKAATFLWHTESFFRPTFVRVWNVG